jgi:Undecaprenyl-phosphate glucose phosphotransferase
MRWLPTRPYVDSPEQNPNPLTEVHEGSVRSNPMLAYNLRHGRGWLTPTAVERFAMLSDAVLVVSCGALGAYGYRTYDGTVDIEVATYATAAVLIAVNFILLINLRHGYQLKSIANPIRQMQLTLTTWTVVFAAFLAAGFIMKASAEFSRGAVLSFFILGLVALPACKLITSRLTLEGLNRGLFTNNRVVVVAEQGLSASSSVMHELLMHGYRPARVLEITENELSSPLMMSAFNARFFELISYCQQNDIEQVFLLFAWERHHIIDSLVDILKVLPVPIHLIPDANITRYLKYKTVSAGNVWTTELRRAPLTRWECRVKRLFDFCGAAFALVFFAPIMLIAALLIKYDSKGPVLFRQNRNGFNGSTFLIYKFRTMMVAENGPVIIQAKKNDPRVTRIGGWLRKTSIDELPQLLNVLNGEMALVGPRPHAAVHNSAYEQLIGNYAFRHHVKPGITGWAQVNGYRGETKGVELMEKRVEYDLWYINNWSIWLDILILTKTAFASFRQSTAY